MFKRIINYIRKKSLTDTINLFQSQSLRQDSLSWNTKNFLTANDISLYTNKAISRRADDLSMIEFTLTDKNGKDVENEQLKQILSKPNSRQNKVEFFKLYQQYKDITGSVYILKTSEESTRLSEGRVIKSLFLLRPDLVQEKFDENGKTTEYIYSKSNGGQTIYQPEEVIASHYHDPLNQLRGVSLLKSGVRAISAENQISDYHSGVLKNGGKIGGVMSFKSNLTKTQLEELSDSYTKKFADAKKSGKPLFTGGDATFLKDTFSPEELAFLESKKMTLDDICILTQVPKILLSNVEGIKFANADASIRVYMANVVDRLMLSLVNTLNEDQNLIPEGQILGYKNPVPANRELIKDENESAVKSYYMTPNEARKRIGLDPIDGGDEILIPWNLIPLSDVGKEDQKKKSKLFLKEFDHPLRDKHTRELYGKIKIKQQDKFETKWIKLMKKYFDGQKKRLIDNLSEKSLKKIILKGPSDDLLNSAFNKEVETKIAIELFLPFIQDILRRNGEETMELMDATDFPFTITNTIGSWVDQSARFFAEEINETTFKKLSNEFSESFANEENRPELIGRIRNTYDGFDKTRATTIARTEVLGAANKGTFEGYKQAGAPIKIWVTVGDSHVRDSHAAQDGEERPIDDRFTNGLLFPGDKSTGQPGEVVNCRCQI